MSKKDKQMEQRIARAMRSVTPDPLPKILDEIDRRERLGIEKNTLPFPETHPRRPISSALVALAAVVALVLGSLYGYGMLSTESIISFDVNPSIELRVNRWEKVREALPLNDDGAAVLDGMELKNVQLDVAVNAIIGSMVKQGYISQVKNSVLITVDSSDNTKGAALQQRLTRDVGGLLSSLALDGAVISQTLTEDERLKSLAEANQISLGKAALVDLLVQQDPQLRFEDVAPLPINDINLLIASRQVSLQGVEVSGSASSDSYIGKDRAAEIALAQAGLAAADLSAYEIQLDYDDGVMMYEVEFEGAGVEYEYDIDALTGEILSQKSDGQKHHKQDDAPPVASDVQEPSPATSGSSDGQGGAIGQDQAAGIAFAHAGVAATDASKFECKLDTDDGLTVYEIEFTHGGVDYDYTIDALSGQILSWESEED